MDFQEQVSEIAAHLRAHPETIIFAASPLRELLLYNAHAEAVAFGMVIASDRERAARLMEC